MAGITAGLMLFFVVGLAFAQAPYLIKDINTSVIVPPAASITDFGKLCNAVGTLFFPASDPAHGSELWTSTGTAGSTRLVRDIQLGAAGSNIGLIKALNGIAYFSADDGVRGHELWRSDGTSAGTFMVKDINPGAATSDILGMATLAGSLYFRGRRHAWL